MLTLGRVMLLIKRLEIKADHYYIGKLDEKNDKSIGIYQLKSGRGYEIAIGGKDTTKTRTKYISILVHWNRNANDTEVTALKIQDQLPALVGLSIDGNVITHVHIINTEPVDVGTDERGVYERVIECALYYESED